MDTQMGKAILKIIPHAAAFISANGTEDYRVEECNELFHGMFNEEIAKSSDIISAISKIDANLGDCLLNGISDLVNGKESELTRELPGYNVILSKMHFGQKDYILMILFFVGRKIQVAVKNFQSFFNVIDDMLLVGTQEGEILYANDAVTKKLGYTQEELKKTHMLALHPKEIREEAEEIFSDMFKHKRDVCPLPLLKKNGQYLPVETRVWFGDWNGEERMFAIIRDMSKEQENLDRFTKIFDLNPACMIVTSMETGVLTQVNKAFLRTFGFEESEVIGKSLVELDLIHDMESFETAKEELNTSGFFGERVLKARKKSGELVIGLFSGEMVEAQYEKFAMTAMVDITHQVETERNLARKSELQEVLIGLSSRYINCSLENIEEEIQASLELVGRFVEADRVYIFDYDYVSGTTSNTFEWCTDLVVPQREFLQELPLDSIPDWTESHRKGEIIHIPDVSELDGTVSSVKEILEPQGVKSLVTIPMMFDDKCMGFVGFDAVKEKHVYTESEIDLLKFYTQILTNIHLRKAHEQEIQTARVRAEKANEAKNFFIAKTSHELRNPLNGAWGFVNLLEETSMDSKQQAYVSNSIQSLGNAIRILNDLLDISKIENNEMHLKDGDINIYALLKEAIIPYNHEISRGNIKLNIILGSDTPHNLLGDFSRLKQILGNLVLNAVTHGKPTEIEIGCNLKKQDEDIAEMLFFVKDNGLGMSEEIIDQIFKLFYKKDSNSMGSGLGLPICKELVNFMGGEIWVESTPKKGSAFYFVIPFRLSKETGKKTKKTKAVKIKDLKGLKVLLAEDNSLNCELVMEILKPKGLLVTAVGNGQEAIKALEKDKFDLILMDIQMPVMGGIEAVKSIRKSKNQIPIIALTGAVLAQEKQSYIESGFNEIVEKPIFVDTLFNKIEQVLAV